MSFLPTATLKRIVPGTGPAGAKIAIVGEAPGAYENAQLKPFVGPAGGVLEQCLHAAGLIRSEVYLTNVIKVQPKGNDISPFFDGKTFSAEGQDWRTQLYAELDDVKPNVVVACGKTAMAALAGRVAITALRGYVFPTVGLAHCQKVIPTIHPAACLYDRKGGDKGSLATKDFKPYLYRYVIAGDFKKARVEGEFQELRRPERQLIFEYENVNEALEWLAYYEDQAVVGFDIEVVNFSLACISFCSSPELACSIPLAGCWSEYDEMLLWRGIQRVLRNDRSTKIVHNGYFDVQFLLKECGIEVKGPVHDTMIGHSVLFPELPKGLGFVGSVYCGAQAFWKDLWKFDNIKDEA